jgi:hypothetical protein
MAKKPEPPRWGPPRPEHPPVKPGHLPAEPVEPTDPEPDNELPDNGETPETPEQLPTKSLRQLFTELEGKIHGLSVGSNLDQDQVASIKAAASAFKAELAKSE